MMTRNQTIAATAASGDGAGVTAGVPAESPSGQR